MRIALDVSVLRHGLNSGSAVYTYNLVHALLQLDDAPRVSGYFGARSSAAAEEALNELSLVGARIIPGPRPWRWSPDGLWWLPRRPANGFGSDSVDVFHAGEFFIPALPPTPVVATVYDLTTLLYPKSHIAWNRWLHAHRLRRIERYVDRVLTISDSTRQDLLRYTKVPEEKIDLVSAARGTSLPAPTAAAASATLAKLGLADVRFILCTGTIEPRKNHIRLIRAFGDLPAEFSDVHLVVAGGDGWNTADIRAAAVSSFGHKRIHLPGFVPAEELQVLYTAAKVFAFPSLYEGFGLPVLEAMAAGVPVLTSNVSSLPEVARGAALLVDPYSAESIRDGLKRLLSEAALRTDLVQRGLVREKQFTWQRVAELTMQAYRRAITNFRPSVR